MLRVLQVRRMAVANSLFGPTALAEAIERMGFVQADPIRAPARAQDLILRHRVADYRIDDLDRAYASLDIDEDFLYAYGFVARRVWRLLHPRHSSRLRAFDRKVLGVVSSLGTAHPRALEAHLGAGRVVNAWGGYSKATTDALERLHWHGLLRVARRERGIRIYEPRAMANGADLPPDERLAELVRVYVSIFAPAPERSLWRFLPRHASLGKTRRAIEALIKTGELRRDSVDGVSYISPSSIETVGPPPRVVRFLAPFDPLVWDRTRFEHLWGWPYRFEGYTPVAKRVRGYYAMPLLWKDDVIGWANVGATGAVGVVGAEGAEGGVPFEVKVGFVRERPREKVFWRELEAEVARLRTFLEKKRAAPLGDRPSNP